MTKGSVVGIVIVIFLVVFLIVDATCCYKNHCGLLMSIAVKLFGQKVPGMKMIDEGSPNGWVGVGSWWKAFVWNTQLFVWDNTNFKTFVRREVKGISTPRGSLQMAGVKKEAGELTEVTCDKVSLTKHEYVQSQLSVHTSFSNILDNHVIILFKMFAFRSLKKNLFYSILCLIFNVFSFVRLSDWFVISLEQKNTAR